MSVRMMRKLLEGHEIEYTITQQAASSDGPDMDRESNQSERMLAETVMLKIDGGFAMVVVPASHDIRLELLKEMVDAESAHTAEVHEVDELFPDCDADAIPPFGMLYGMRVFVAEPLSRSQNLAFYAGSRKQVAELLYTDYARLVRPIVAPISAAGAAESRPRSGRDVQSRPRRDDVSSPVPMAAQSSV